MFNNYNSELEDAGDMLATNRPYDTDYTDYSYLNSVEVTSYEQITEEKGEEG